MAESGGRDGSGIDDVVLDEAFVRGATISELDAERRGKAKAKERAKADKRERRLYRRHVRRRRLRRTVQVAALVAGVGLVGAAAGASGAGPLAFLQGDRPERSGTALNASSAGAASAGDASAPASTTSSTIGLERRSYAPGDCVLWDQSVNRWGDPNDVEVVACDRPHLMEVTGRLTLERRAYPTEAEWDAVFDTGECAAMAVKYLGAALDPYGRYSPTGILPQEEGWRNGDREVWCGLYGFPAEAGPSEPNVIRPFSGAVDRRAGGQHRIHPVGACLGPDGEGLTSGTVPCDGPHVVEIAGHVDLAGPAGGAPAPEQYDDLVGDRCHRQAMLYAGRNLRDPVAAGWLEIPPASWDAGRRTVECMVAEYRNQDALTITRRLGAPTD